MPEAPHPAPLAELALHIATLLRERQQTVAVVESSSGGLVSAALLAIPGASAFFVGGAVVYTRRAGKGLLGLEAADMVGMRGETEPFASLIAARVRQNLRATWGLGESGAAGPNGSPYGDPPGRVCLAVCGAGSGDVAAVSRTVATQLEDRVQNMDLFARHLLSLFEEVLAAQPPSGS